MFGACLDLVWTMCGPCVDHVWAMFGPCLGHVWAMFGPCLDHVWGMFGPVEICPIALAADRGGGRCRPGGRKVWWWHGSEWRGVQKTRNSDLNSLPLSFACHLMLSCSILCREVSSSYKYLRTHVTPRPTNEQTCLGHVWTVFGPCLCYVWTMFRPCLQRHFWATSGPLLGRMLGHVFTMFGPGG
jgi:hypothetical protein